MIHLLSFSKCFISPGFFFPPNQMHNSSVPPPYRWVSESKRSWITAEWALWHCSPDRPSGLHVSAPLSPAINKGDAAVVLINSSCLKTNTCWHAGAPTVCHTCWTRLDQENKAPDPRATRLSTLMHIFNFQLLLRLTRHSKIASICSCCDKHQLTR